MVLREECFVSLPRTNKIDFEYSGGEGGCFGRGSGDKFGIVNLLGIPCKAGVP
jgi:hypothetical protein